jgi:tRNA pseudouridine32 synthase/23S rRNA pseudouridine746 synthase
MLGDSLYAPPDILARTPRLMLPAQDIGFPHPFSEEAMFFTAPVAWSAANPYLAGACT